jgi:hypothetical protein
MKKLCMLLVVLALLATSLPLFAADVTFTGRMAWYANVLDDGPDSNTLIRYRPVVTVKVDDYNTIVTELRADGLSWSTEDFFLQYFYVTTDIVGALMLDLPVTIKTTIGKFEPGFTDWAYVSESGWENYYTWPNGIADVGPFDQTAMQLDVGFGPAAFHLYSDFAGFMMFGLSGGFGPVSGWLTYQAPAGAFGEGILGVEAKYTGEFGDFKLGVPVFFRYKLGTASDGSLPEDFTYGVGLGADYSMFHVAAGVEGDSVDALDNVVVDVSVAPMEPVKIQANVYMDLAAANSLQGINLAASYKFGAAKFILGYIIAGEDHNAIPLNGDTFALAGGLYGAVDISY